MTIAPAQSGSSASAASSTKGVFSSIADQKDMFLQLLVAQLKNQDPSSPMDQKDMMAQMAQFTSVEQMTNMVKTLETLNFNSTVSQSVGLIGKSVDYVAGTDENQTIKTSTVTAVSTGGGQVNLIMEDGTRVAPSAVVRVSA
jgi:flagellar basal-body rod modification protein FlgD